MNKIFGLFKSKKNFIFFSLLKVLVMGVSLITNIIIIRKLNVGDFGIFSIAMMFTGLVTTFGFSWSSSSILYFGSKEKATFGSLNRTFWARNIIIGASLIIVTILFVIFRKNINIYIGIDVSFLILAWLYVSVAEDYLNQYFLAIKRQVLSSMLSLTAKLFYIIIILMFEFDVKTLIMMNIISHATVLVYVLGIKRADIGRFEYDGEWFKEILNFSLWQLFGFSGLYLINFGDTAVIKHFMTTEDVAIYNASYKLFNTVANFSFVISSYYAGSVSAYFTQKDYKNIKRFFYKERYFILALSTIMHLLVMLLAKPIIITLYGSAYSQSVSIFIVLMIGSIFKYIAVFYMLYFNTNGKHKFQQSINILRAILNLILDVIFIQLFGLIGPAIATTLAILLTLIVSAYFSEKEIKNLSVNEIETMEV